MYSAASHRDIRSTSSGNAHRIAMAFVANQLVIEAAEKLKVVIGGATVSQNRHPAFLSFPSSCLGTPFREAPLRVPRGTMAAAEARAGVAGRMRTKRMTGTRSNRCERRLERNRRASEHARHQLPVWIREVDFDGHVANPRTRGIHSFSSHALARIGSFPEGTSRATVAGEPGSTCSTYCSGTRTITRTPIGPLDHQERV